MPNKSTKPIDPNEQLCIDISSIIFYLPYQIVLLVNVIFSVAAIFLCTHFVRKYIWGSTFHPNFKLLITMYFLDAIIHSILFLATYLSILERMWGVQSYCDVVIRTEIYIIIHFPLACCLISGMFTQIIMVIERVFATINVRNYEYNSSILNTLIYLFFTIILPTSLIFWAYENADWTSPSVSALSPPGGVESRLNILFIGAFVLAIIALITLRILKYANKKQEHNSHFTLSGRYQVVENIYTTKFITSILINNMIIAIIYLAGTYSLRNIKFDFFKDQNPLHATVKMVFYLHPLFAFTLPLISTWYLKKIKKEKLNKSNKLMQLQTKGREGSDAYSQLLQDQWKQHYHKS